MIEIKKFRMEVKEADIQEDGTFTGLSSTYGNIDQGGDVVNKGAFTKTLKERGNEVPILWSHDTKQPIGLGSLEDSPNGLKINGRLNLDLQVARDVYSNLKARIVKGLSIGFETIDKKMVEGVRHLTEVKLFEVSLCLFPMNEQAGVHDVKEVDGKVGRRHSAVTMSRLTAIAAQQAILAQEIQTLLADEAAVDHSTSDEGAVTSSAAMPKANSIGPEQFHAMVSNFKFASIKENTNGRV